MARKATAKPAAKKTAAKASSTKANGSNGAEEARKGEALTGTKQNAQQLDPALLEKISEIRSKVNETFGQVALAMMAIPRYRHQSVGDLNHILLEPLIRDRVAIASAEKGNDSTKAPLAGVAIWASVSDEVEAKIREQIKAGASEIKIHPLITKLVDPEVLKKMGVSRDEG